MTRPVFLHDARTRARRCPICLHETDAAVALSVNPADPHPAMQAGAVTVCVYCGAVLVVLDESFRLATDTDVAELDPDLRTILFDLSAKHSRHASTKKA
jgi:hypothetical protein